MNNAMNDMNDVERKIKGKDFQLGKKLLPFEKKNLNLRHEVKIKLEIKRDLGLKYLK